MESMDDIEMLLPGLKVSSSLIRQQPLRRGGARKGEQQHQVHSGEHNSFQGSRARSQQKAGPTRQGSGKAMKAGSKRRRPSETWALDLDLSAGDAKRYQAGEAAAPRRLPPPLRVDEEDGGALDFMQAGITTSMRDELIESPRTTPPGHQQYQAPAKPDSSPSSTPSSSAAASAEPAASPSAAAAAPEDLAASAAAPCERAAEGAGNVTCAEMAAEGKPVRPAAATAAEAYPDVMLSSCGLERYLSGMQDDIAITYPSSPPCNTAAEAEHGDYLRGGGSPEGEILPRDYVKSKSAPPRMKGHLPSLSQGPAGGFAGGSSSGGGEEDGGGARPVPAGSAAGAPSPASGPQGRQSPGGSGPSSSPPASPPAYQKCSLSRTEKWHERISLATMRLKARSLPCTPDRARTAHSLAAQ